MGSVQGRSKGFNTLTSPILIIFGIEVPPGEKLRKPKIFGSRTPRGVRFLGTAKSTNDKVGFGVKHLVLGRTF